MATASMIDLPAWAIVTPKRAEHIARVTMLLNAWAAAMRLTPEKTLLFTEAGRLHDALRDAPEAQLRALANDYTSPVGLLHGPAAATFLESEGERRQELLDAIRYHTVGYSEWGMVGKALYMADFLEPGRKFSRQDRQFLATIVPSSFEGVFRQVVRMRLEWSIREGNTLFPETVSLWNSFQENVG